MFTTYTKPYIKRLALMLLCIAPALVSCTRHIAPSISATQRMQAAAVAWHDEKAPASAPAEMNTRTAAESNLSVPQPVSPHAYAARQPHYKKPHKRVLPGTEALALRSFSLLSGPAKYHRQAPLLKDRRNQEQSAQDACGDCIGLIVIIALVIAVMYVLLWALEVAPGLTIIIITVILIIAILAFLGRIIEIIENRPSSIGGNG